MSELEREHENHESDEAWDLSPSQHKNRRPKERKSSKNNNNNNNNSWSTALTADETVYEESSCMAMDDDLEIDVEYVWQGSSLRQRPHQPSSSKKQSSRKKRAEDLKDDISHCTENEKERVVIADPRWIQESLSRTKKKKKKKDKKSRKKKSSRTNGGSDSTPRTVSLSDNEEDDEMEQWMMEQQVMVPRIRFAAVPTSRRRASLY